MTNTEHVRRIATSLADLEDGALDAVFEAMEPDDRILLLLHSQRDAARDRERLWNKVTEMDEAWPRRALRDIVTYVGIAVAAVLGKDHLPPLS